MDESFLRVRIGQMDGAGLLMGRLREGRLLFEMRWVWLRRIKVRRNCSGFHHPLASSSC